MTNSIPLVSIIVITYNSSKYVLETLESAKNQSYQNIELIVSDDGSTDETVEICSKWLGKNKERFVRTELVRVEKNTGIPANCNRGVKAAKGEWIKLIAGDDILLENCIKDNIGFVRNTEIRILFSQIQHFTVNQETNMPMYHDIGKLNEAMASLSAGRQYQVLLKGNFVVATPSSFLSRKMLEEVGFFDEEFPLIEDYTLWLKCTASGFKIYSMDRLTVLYRIHDVSVDMTIRKENYLVDQIEYRNLELRKKYVYPNYSFIGRLSENYLHKLNSLFINCKRKSFNVFFYKILTKYGNPFKYIFLINRKFFPGYDLMLKRKIVKNYNKD